MLFDDRNDSALRLFDSDAPKLGNGFALLQLDEAHLGKALRQASYILRPATIHHNDLERRGVLLREHGSQAIIDERRSNDGSDDNRNCWRCVHR